MFKWLRRRKERPTIGPPPLPACMHVWKDFPWYLYIEREPYDDRRHFDVRIQIFEPYVCAHCGERKNVELYNMFRSYLVQDDINRILNSIDDLYGENIRPKPVIEDMINDYILVDREKLAILEKIQNRNGEYKNEKHAE